MKRWENVTVVLAVTVVCVALFAPSFFRENAATDQDVVEVAVIVEVFCEERLGDEDWTTVIEFGDRRRARRPGKWGAVGDRFMATRIFYSKYDALGWR